MTSNRMYLQDALSKRIVQGKTSAQDLSLLSQLLRCQQRRCLMLGAIAGIALAALLQTLAVYAF